MDLLQGYGSSDSDNDSVSFNVQPTSQNKPAAAKPTSNIQLSTTKRGKRILSLGAVLPPEIFDRLTRPADADDSSTSSFEDGDDKRVGSKKRKRAKDGDENDVTSSKLSNNSRGNSVDRTELNSFLSELRSAPMEKKDGNDSKSNNNSQNKKSEKLGMAFMSYTETKHNSNEVVDVHAAKPPAVRPSTTGDANLQRKSAASSLTFSRLSTAAPVVNKNVSMPQYSSAISYNNIPEYHVPEETKQQMNAPTHSTTTTNDDYNASSTMVKSRKQRREEERALRSGAAFQNPSAATEIHQPSPTEFAPTAHAAAIASRAARFRGVGGGNGGGGSVTMYDPKAGGDVAGQGIITGKHRSKHQINSLMANAISLEAHRAAESELARISGGQKGGSSRADAKRKYGW